MSTPASLSAAFPRHAADMLDRVRSNSPRVHCLMNTVVQKLVADGLSALGAIPSMTSSTEEVEAFAMKCDALTINLGTLDRQRREAIGLAVAVAARRDVPWVLDPAHCDYSPPRAAFAQELLARGPGALRANEAEYPLLRLPGNVVAVRTGATDRIERDGHAIIVENGHALMAKVTGTGCLSGAAIAAFLAVADDPFAATAAAMLAMGVAAEIAASTASGPGSFEPALIDALAGLTATSMIERARVTHGNG